MDGRKHFAAIDIGSNAVRLLIKCITNDAKNPLAKVQLLRVPLRLGEDAFLHGVISAQKREQLLSLMVAYRQLMNIYAIDGYRACATSAMREAANAENIIREIRKQTGIAVEVISGEEEARLAARNRIEEIVGNSGRYAFVDVGGGSTEITLIKDGETVSRESFNVGTVRLLAGVVQRGTLEALEEAARTMREDKELTIIGTGGNISRLARIAGKHENEAYLWKLDVKDLKELYKKLAPMTIEERMREYDIKPDRADVIEPAAELFIMLSDALNADKILVPTAGISDGIIEELYRKSLS